MAYGADEDVSSSDEDGAIIISDEGAIGVSLDGVMTSDITEEASDITDEASDATELIADSTDDETAASDEETAASDDDTTTDELTTGASLDETTALEGAVSTTTGAGPRLKIQIRPMITITATTMIIQVLRFMGFALCWRRVDRGVLS